MAGSGKSATREFRIQRSTALALIPLAFVLIAMVIALAGSDYETAHAYLGNPILALLVLVIIVVAAAHMRIGMGEIIADYVHNGFLKALSVFGNFLFCAAVVLGSVYAAAKILFGF